MVLRKLYLLGGTLALTLPRHFVDAAELQRGQYIEVYLHDKETLIIKKHGDKPKGIVEQKGA